MNTVNYNNKAFRLIVAINGAVYSVLHGRFSEINTALHQPRFYIAIIYSSVVAYILVFSIHRITVWLDRVCQWRKQPLERILLQICLGVLSPALLDLLFMTFLYLGRGKNIWYSGFLRADLPVVLILLILLNLYYCLHYLILTSNSNNRTTGDVLESVETSSELSPEIHIESLENSVLNVDYKGQSFHLQVREEVLYFYRDNKYVHLVTATGHDIPLATTIESVAAKYQPLGFSQINRGLVINCRVVEDYKTEIGGKKLSIVIKQDLLFLIKLTGYDHFIVTKTHIADFKRQLEKTNSDSKGV